MYLRCCSLVEVLILPCDDVSLFLVLSLLSLSPSVLVEDVKHLGRVVWSALVTPANRKAIVRPKEKILSESTAVKPHICSKFHPIINGKSNAPIGS